MSAAMASVICPSCRGQGYVDISRPEIACTRCGGDGVIPAPSAGKEAGRWPVRA